MKIRKACERDRPSLHRLGKLLHDKSPTYSEFSWSPEKVDRLIDACLNPELPYCAFVALDDERDGEPMVGMMLGVVTEKFFSYDLLATDLLLFVSPLYRGRNLSRRLVRMFEEWADEHAVRRKMLGTTTQLQPERTKRLFMTLGYEPIGHLLRK